MTPRVVPPLVGGPSEAERGRGGRERSEPVPHLLAHADDNMILAQRLGELISNAPELEIDIAIGNIALDHLGVARALYGHVAKLEGEGRDEDHYAMFRDEREFLNLLLVEQPNGDFAQTVVRQMLFDVYQLQLWEDLSTSKDRVLAGIAGKAMKEAAYHERFSAGWVVRLGDGTEESHTRTQGALDRLWQYTGEMFEGEQAVYQASWERRVKTVITEAGLVVPDDPYQRTGGRQGFHTEHLGHLLTEMQWMQRSHPGLQW
ncbi:MAG: phenylacetate-CoA oxygenase subunit PaaC [Actinobacteria bacterium]|nr:phenylacetate-CoA oxygenase subunit PaaC [Actinomycetota bacterium]